MYYITYKNILRSNKGLNDFQNWLKTYWPIQKKWGATSVNLWLSNEDNKKILFCRYTVENLENWNLGAMEVETDTMVKALSDIIDINQISIKITLTSSVNSAQ